MTARELYDNLEPATASMISPSEGGSWVIQPGEDQATILRALDLLACVEESEDELVRELRDQADEERQFEYPERAKLLDMAAAAIVALKAHAEAMAATLDTWAEIDQCKCHALDAYRRDFPKEGA